MGIVLVSTKGTRVEKSFKLGFQASNNEAEYKAFLARRGWPGMFGRMD